LPPLPTTPRAPSVSRPAADSAVIAGPAPTPALAPLPSDLDQQDQSDQTAADQAKQTRPLSALDIETQRLRPDQNGRSALDTETERLVRLRPAIETETQRISLAPQGDGALEQASQSAQDALADADTLRLARKAAPTDAARDALADADTFHLAPKDGLTDAETFPLPRKGPALDAGAYRLMPGRRPAELGREPVEPDDMETAPHAALPPPITPGSAWGAYESMEPALSWDEGEDLGDLKEEARQALEATSVMFSMDVKAPRTAPPTPKQSLEAPASVQPPAPPSDETLAMVRALRGEMKRRPPFWRVALSPLRQPATSVIALFMVVQALALSLWGAPRPLAAPSLALLTGGALWQPLASLISTAGGTLALQIAGILLMAVTGLAMAGATRHLFGKPAALGAALAFALSGPVLYVAHLPTTSQLAFAGVAMSFWAITKASTSHENRWLIGAAVAFVVAALAQYSALLALLSLACVALALYSRPAWVGGYITGLIIIAILVASVSAVTLGHAGVFTLALTHTKASRSLDFSVSAPTFQLLYDGAVIWALVIAGWIVTRWRGAIAGALGAATFVYPVYLALANSAQDAEWLLIFGFIFGLPLAGAAITTLWTADAGPSVKWRLVTVALLIFIATAGIIQARTLESGNGSIPAHPIHVSLGKVDVAPLAVPDPRAHR
jgi:hypothetical protein